MNNKELIERLRALSTDNLCFEPELSFDDYRVIATALEQADAENAELAARLEVAREALENYRQLDNAITDVVVGTLHYLDICDKNGPKLAFEDARRTKENAIERYLNEPAFRAKATMLVGSLMTAIQKHNREALSTLTTGNAVARIEARVLREAIALFENQTQDSCTRMAAAELRKLAEQREQEGKR